MYFILGFTGRTSYSLAQFLLKNDSKELVIVDQNNTPEQQRMIRELSQLGVVHNELGNQDPTLLEKYTPQKVFISPGVPRSIALIQKALALKIVILNDIEYFYQKFPNRTYVAITGTDGKTTVTTWIGNALSKKKSVLLVGNIGTPIFEYADEQYNKHIFVIELSSFQLESIDTFRPKIAVIINIHEDHLDRYRDMDQYAFTKKNIFNNQKVEDSALINKDNAYIVSFEKEIEANKIYFSLKEKAHWYYDKGIIYCKEDFFFDTKDLKVVGQHNIQNALITAIVANILGIDKDDIYVALKEFQGVAHRLEFVDNKDDILFYNDSKATTVQSMKLALHAFNHPVLLLAGGRSKGMDFRQIKDTVKQKTKKVFVFGELAEELSLAWREVDCVICTTLQHAFESSLQYAQKNDIVLLSPGGTSFDEFLSYEHRGEFFRELVKNKK